MRVRMILATNKCGCPSKKEKPPCSPCCASKKVTVKSREERHPPPPKIIEPPICCPLKPYSDSKYQRPSKLRSEIVEKGLPYKEIEAIINNNRVVIRTQTEPGKPEYDPPCDCIEDSASSRQIETDETPLQNSGNRTVTLYPQARQEDRGSIDSENQNGDESLKMKNITIEHAENPNIFLFRMRKKSTTGDKRFNIDLEFKTPRPWSTKKRLEYNKQIKPGQSVTSSTLDECTERERKRKEVSSKNRKRKIQ